MLGTCLPGQDDQTEEWKVCLRGLARNAKSFVNLSCMGTVRGYLYVVERPLVPVKDVYTLEYPVYYHTRF
jgi:hypothetical protein